MFTAEWFMIKNIADKVNALQLEYGGIKHGIFTVYIMKLFKKITKLFWLIWRDFKKLVLSEKKQGGGKCAYDSIFIKQWSKHSPYIKRHKCIHTWAQKNMEGYLLGGYMGLEGREGKRNKQKLKRLYLKKIVWAHLYYESVWN